MVTNQIEERDKLISTPTLGELLDLTPQQIRLGLHRGSFPLKPIRVGRLLRWRLRDVRSLIEGGGR
jgi:hypothetical protein